jgi:hypothetical protein
MYSRNRRIGVAMVALVVSLSIAPLLSAAQKRDVDRERGFREKEPNPIVRVINNLRGIVKKIAGHDEYPVPPLP